MRKIKNNTAGTLTFEGQEILPGAYYELAESEIKTWAISDSVLSAIGAGTLIVNNGETDILGVAAQIAFLQNKNPQEVVTQLEKDDKTLGLASCVADFVGSIAALSMEIPGTPGEVGRFVKEGYAFTDVYAWGLRVTRVALVDKAYLYAGALYPAEPAPGVTWEQAEPNGVTLGNYCDPTMPADNQGWRFWAEEGGQGGVDIDNLAGYGSLLAGCFLEIDVTKPANSSPAKVAANIQWGIQNE